MIRLLCAEDPINSEIQTADALKSVVHSSQLHTQLLVIGHMLQGAAAALAVDRAGRLLTRRGGGMTNLAPTVNSRGSHLEDFNVPNFAGDRIFYKYRSAANTADTGSV